MKTGMRELGIEGREGSLVGKDGTSLPVAVSLVYELVWDGSLDGLMEFIRSVGCRCRVLSQAGGDQGRSGEEEEVEGLGMHLGG